METKTNMGVNVNTELGANPAMKMEAVSIQLAKGISVEQMEADFFDKATLHEAPYRLFQLNSRGKRYYYSYDADAPVFYPSVTTILHNVMPENRNLTEWKLSLGKEKADAYTMEKARYGSFLHSQIAELMIAGKYDLEQVGDRLKTYSDKNHLPVAFAEMYEDEAKADLVAFAKWMRDYDVQPLAIEVSLYSPSLGYAGTIDCVCSLREYSKDDTRKKAQSDERIYAIVDFKSGRKGFYDDYAIQLELYRRMWNETFPDIEIKRTFNIAPKDWRSTVKKVPSYSFEEQTENPVVARTDCYLELFKLMDEETRKITICGGTLDLTKDPTENVQVLDLEELVQKHKGEEKEEVVEGDIETLFSEE